MAVDDTTAKRRKRKRKKKVKLLPLAQRQLIAFNRFGLGARPGEFAKIKDPLATLKKELATPGVTLIPKTALLPTYAQACSIGETGKSDLPGVAGTNDPSVLVFRRELDARFAKHLSVKVGFAERLVLFWANHFSMSSNKEVRTVVRGTIGQLERDVIRKHALGKFPDMLVGVMTHPAMICYLDNQISVGPNSISAKNGNTFTDVNVNLAREIMELHTVGSGGGYTEADVKALALILSGWAFVTESDTFYTDDGGSPATVGQFIYKPRWHEPFTSIKHMGVTRSNSGQATGIAVLRWLAMRPQTAEHLAFKMIKHFITDRPTPAMVEPLKVAYLKSGGNLKSMALAMLSLKSAWKMPLTKYRTPYETAVAQYRAMRTRHTNYAVDGSNTDTSNYHITRWNFIFLKQKPWECLDPDGWDDDSAEWLNSDAVRVGIAAAYESVTTYAPASVAAPGRSPIPLTTKAGVVALGKSILGTNLSASTIAAINAAPDAKKALTVLFVSPEFMRR